MACNTSTTKNVVIIVAFWITLVIALVQGVLVGYMAYDEIWCGVSLRQPHIFQVMVILLGVSTILSAIITIANDYKPDKVVGERKLGFSKNDPHQK